MTTHVAGGIMSVRPFVRSFFRLFFGLNFKFNISLSICVKNEITRNHV